MSVPGEQSVAVLVATFNRAKYLGECLDSLLNQTRPLDQIIVIDDGSTDETQQVLAAYGDRIQVFAKDNGGKSTALNLGLQKTSCDWVWFFDDDDVALPDAAQRLLGALQKCPAATFVYSQQIIGRERDGQTLQRERVVRLTDSPPGGLFNQALKQFPFLMQGMLVSRQLVESVGRFDERYLRGQDYEFCLRMIRFGSGVALQEPTFIWRVHDGPRGPSRGLHQGAERGQVWQKFSEMMARELRDSIPLSEYLVPHRSGEAELPADLRRQALLERAAVMVSKGLVSEALEDLAAAAGLSQALRKRLTEESLRSIWLMATYPAFLSKLLLRPNSMCEEFALASGGIKHEVLRALARGLLWQARRGDWSFTDRMKLLRAGLRLWVA
jgi:glycosyltransferase involved in cell wall biosynthesis